GKSLTATAEENETLDLPADARVTKAVYGDLPVESAKPIDLTAKLSRLVEHGSLTAQIDNTLAGADPVPNQPKECRVDYSLEGVRKPVPVPENQMLALGDVITSDEPDPLVLHADANGKMTVSATIRGTVNLTLASGKKVSAQVSNVPAPMEIPGSWNLT